MGMREVNIREIRLDVEQKNDSRKYILDMLMDNPRLRERVDGYIRYVNMSHQ